MNRIATLLFLFSTVFVWGQSQRGNLPSRDLSLSWGTEMPFAIDHEGLSLPYFTDAVYPGSHPFTPAVKLYTNSEIRLTGIRETPVNTVSEVVGGLGDQYEILYYGAEGGQSIAHVLAFRVDNGQAYRLDGFSYESLERNIGVASSKLRSSSGKMMANSPLSTGNWAKIAVSADGIYKITPSYLSENGMGSGHSINSITVFGNQMGLLPERTNAPRPESLQEVPLQMVDANGDGVFNGSDYALFFAKGPHQWEYLSGLGRYQHTYNVYENYTFFFVGVDRNRAKNIVEVSGPSGATNKTCSGFDDFAFHEEEKYNLLGTGRQWMGELFDFTLSFNYVLPFPTLDINEPIFMRARALGRSTTSSTFMTYSYNGTQVGSGQFPAVSSWPGADFVTENIVNANFNVNSPTIAITATYQNSNNPSAIAYMDYIEVNVRRPMQLIGGHTQFRDAETVGAGNVTQFSLSNANANYVVWDVTDPLQTFRVESQVSGSNLGFAAETDSLRTFVALSGSSYPNPIYVQKMVNQDLLGMTTPKYFIVSHPSFVSASEKLADYHRGQGLSVEVVTTEQIFNEFGSGSGDPTAIRDFLRHHFYAGDLQYALMMGDATYDYKAIGGIDHNFVPTYQSVLSFSLRTSVASDDYYGLLTDNEGESLQSGTLDIGVGRFVVKSSAEAQQVVDKTIYYGTLTESNSSYWQNKVLMVADDNDDPTGWEAMFVNRMENLSSSSLSKYPYLNFEKVYADAYTQVTISGSQRYPEARKDIFDKVQSGNLVTTYFGHGGEVGWAFERILQLADVNGWNNLPNMPVFITITCEFSRYDDPTRVSAGEQLLLNPNGGSVALITTTREVSAASGISMNNAVFDTLFGEVNGESMRLGDIVTSSKNTIVGEFDRPRFSLLGDPAIRLRKPNDQIVTTSVNGVPAGTASDTLKALTKVVIEGEVRDGAGNLIPDFNGFVYPAVYDKMYTRTTLVNDGVGGPLPFKLQDNVLYRGKVSAVNGKFSFEFIVPLDIAYAYGLGKLSYYGHAEGTEATGFDNTIYIGGLDTTANPDEIGPEIELFMNSENFVNGGLTGPDPLSIARVVDSSGINTLGSSIGHDIVGILDGNVSETFVLNDYYEAELDSYQKGAIQYPFYDLAPGEHQLLIRVWDVYNNPSETTIDFFVAESGELALQHVLNYPNPFTTYTEFQFEHNRENQPLEVQVQILTVSGDLVKTINAQLNSDGNRITGISWDGLDDFGDPIGKGTYIYRLKVKSVLDGATAEKYEKLVILR